MSSALERRTTIQAPASKSELLDWQIKTLHSMNDEHVGHGIDGPFFVANCRHCLLRAIKMREVSVIASHFVEGTKAEKGKAYIRSAINEFNMAMMGDDHLSVPLDLISED